MSKGNLSHMVSPSLSQKHWSISCFLWNIRKSELHPLHNTRKWLDNPVSMLLKEKRLKVKTCRLFSTPRLSSQQRESWPTDPKMRLLTIVNTTYKPTQIWSWAAFNPSIHTCPETSLGSSCCANSWQVRLNYCQSQTKTQYDLMTKH